MPPTKMSQKRKRKVPESDVFVQIGFSPEEAAALDVRSRLLSEVVKQARQFSQSELQQLLHEPQPRISDLMRGKVSKFSLETLFRYAEHLHMRPEIKIHRPVQEMFVSA